jgi:hypothetical protein
MAMYQPSFVDTTGYVSGITAGINKAMEYRMKQDKLFSDSMEDLKKSYDTKKMRTKDVPLFINAFEGYRSSLLNYTRVNNSNASAADINAASMITEQAKSRMDEVFGKSSSAFEKTKLFSSAAQSMFKNGIEPVMEFKDAFNKLSNTDLELLSNSDIDVDPFGFKTMLTIDDLKSIDDRILKNIPMTETDEKVVDANGVPVTFKINVPNPGKAQGDIYNIPWLAKKEKRDPSVVSNTIDAMFKLPDGEKFKNYASTQINNLAKALSIDEKNPNTTPAQISEKRMAEGKFGQIKSIFTNIKDVKDILPSQIYAIDRGLLAGKIKGFYYDDKEFKLNMAKIASDFGMDMRSASAAMAMQNAALQANSQANAATMSLLRFALGGGTTIAPDIIDQLKNYGITLDPAALKIINENKLNGGKKVDAIAEALRNLKNKKGSK